MRSSPAPPPLRGTLACLSNVNGAGRWHVTDGRCTHYPDACAWPQALYELVSNGFKFSRGNVRVAAASTAPGIVTLSVTDAGPGVPDEELPRIWGPFHQVLSFQDRGAARRSDGLGLGLFLVGADPSRPACWQHHATFVHAAHDAAFLQ